MIETVDKLLVELILLEESGRKDSALDLQYNVLENWALESQFEKIESWMTDERIQTLSNDLLLSVSVVLKPWKHFLKNNNIFYLKTKETLIDRNSAESIINLLDRLNR